MNVSRKISRALQAAVWCSLAIAAQSGRQSFAAGSQTASADSPPYISWTWIRVVAKPGEPRGWVQFERDCSVCHGSGPAKPGTRALRTKYQGKLPALLEQRTDLTQVYIKYIVRHGVTVMPPFRKTEVSDQDLDAIAAYLTRKRR
ncbi:MAG: cytochrome c [Steroidobacteraceae bacterium]